MRTIIDILHPAHVHFFKNFYFELCERGHHVLVTARRKDCATDLLDRFEIPYCCISKSTRGAGPQLLEFLTRSCRFARIARQFRPDVLTGIMGPTIATVGRLLRCPAYVFYDTEFAKTTNRFVYPLSTKVITPDCYQGSVGKNHLTYPGYHELAYLHPNRFVPDVRCVREAGIDPNQPFCVVRFVGWWATHDRRERGLSTEQKIQVIRTLERYGQVVLSSETDVPAEIADRVYRGSVEDVHHLLSFATLFFGESATMASESAVLGTPAVYIATTGRGYTDDQVKYALVHDYRDEQFDAALATAERLLESPAATAAAATASRARLLREKIDVTEFMLELFEADFGASEQRTFGSELVNGKTKEATR
jgi:predicted glycosyltransferase